MLRRKQIQGGSTLTQQTAKAILASAEGVKAAHVRAGLAGVRRKARELILTKRLEAGGRRPAGRGFAHKAFIKLV